MSHFAITPKFSALVCNNLQNRRCPETGVRIFKYELTNDTSRFPLGRVVCPESGKPGLDHQAVAVLSACLPQLAKLTKQDRLEVIKKLIRLDSQNWQIGKNLATDTKDEVLADRGERLMQQSTADIQQNPNGSLSMIMDYDLDLKGQSLTALMALQQSQAPVSYIPTTAAYRPYSQS